MVDKTPSPLTLERQLRHDSYKTSLKRLQRHLTPTQRRFSRVVHQTTIEDISQALSETICRPYGLLGAGLAGVIGSTVLMALADKRAFSYNYYWVLVFLAGGFILGLLVEWLVSLTQRRPR